MRTIPALIIALTLSAPAHAQSVNEAQPEGFVEGAAGETLVLSAGQSDGLFRMYRLRNLGEGDVSIGAGRTFVDLSPGNTLDYMISGDPLQVTFRGDAEVEFHLIAVAPELP